MVEKVSEEKCDGKVTRKSVIPFYGEVNSYVYKILKCLFGDRMFKECHGSKRMIY